MGYIQEIRQMVGHYPIIAIGATIIVYNEKNEILLNRRTDTGTWGIPGGAMEPGENAEETARRELYEETGLEVEDLKLIDVLSGPEYFFVYPNGDQMHTVIILFEALRVKGELRINDDESKALRFFSLDALPELESRAELVIERLKNGESRSENSKNDSKCL
jgi:ADP-ribose pyrophosphatase YjhB (NUDIX family)